jgi:diacylglycerol kinase
MPRPTKTTIISFRHAFDGMWHMVKTERRTRLHLLLALAAVGIGAWMRPTREGWFFLCFALTLVFLAEMLHTAICACVALAEEQQHGSGTRACQMARGAAALALLVAAATLLVILIYQPV